MVLHYCLIRAAKKSPLDSTDSQELTERLGAARFTSAAARAGVMSDGDAVAYARTRLETLTK